MKFIKFKISRECIFPLDNTAHVRSHKIFYHISAHFRNPGFHSVSKPQKPFFIFRTSPATTIEGIDDSDMNGKLTFYFLFLITVDIELEP